MTALQRALGFAVPTVALVTTLHLAEKPTAGEAIDGVVSGLWFVGVFLLGGWLRLRWGSAGGATGHGRVAREVLVGVAAAGFTWAFLWLFWNVLPTDSLRQATAWVFPINSAIVFASGWLLGPAGVTRESKNAHPSAA